MQEKLPEEISFGRW